MRVWQPLLVLSGFLFSGCSSAPCHTQIEFLSPEGTQLVFQGKQARFPVRLTLTQTDDTKDERGGTPIRFTLQDGFRLKGYLHVFRVKTEEGELTVARCRILPEHVATARTGQPVTIEDFAPNKEALYRLVIGPEYPK